MTTETESLEALHLWLATRLLELRRPVNHAVPQGGPFNGQAMDFGLLPSGEPDGSREHCACGERGWQPNVTTDALLEALRQRYVSGETPLSVEIGLGYIAIDVFGDVYEKIREGWDEERPVHEALCRAARKALEAAS